MPRAVQAIVSGTRVEKNTNKKGPNKEAKYKVLYLIHKSWSKSVLAQWKRTRAPGMAVSVPSGLVVP